MFVNHLSSWNVSDEPIRKALWHRVLIEGRGRKVFLSIGKK